MYRVRQIAVILALALTSCPTPGWADGMVVPQIFYPKVEIPNQQALIHFAEGKERLVIETSFLGEGTNFAWVVPLPAPPQVKPVSESFFSGLQQAFRPRLIHEVHPYYAALLFLCGLGFLGWRSVKDEVSWVVDLPLCLLLAVGAELTGRHPIWGLLAAGLTVCIRIFSRSPGSFALVMVIGATFAACLTFIPRSHGFRLVQTLGGRDSHAELAAAGDVTVVSVQRAGVFDATTLRSANPGAVREWLEQNGYGIPKSAEPAIRHYVEHGWVFVASKARCANAHAKPTALHPLAFTFASATPVYPTRLTAVDNGDCTIDLYVFGKQRATARHFRAVRCDRVADDAQLTGRPVMTGLRVADAEVLALIGTSTVGTKLHAKLSPARMASDAEIKWRMYWRTGARVYSHAGALTIALNVALPLAALCWLLIGASRGGWGVGDRSILRWRWGTLAGALLIGGTLFLVLPKVEVVAVPSPLAQPGTVLE